MARSHQNFSEYPPPGALALRQDPEFCVSRPNRRSTTVSLGANLLCLHHHNTTPDKNGPEELKIILIWLLVFNNGECHT